MNTKIPDPSEIKPPVSNSLPPNTLSPTPPHKNGLSSPPTNQLLNNKTMPTQNGKKAQDGMEIQRVEVSPQRNRSSVPRPKRIVKGGEKSLQQNNKISSDSVSGKQNDAMNGGGDDEAPTNSNKLPNLSRTLMQLTEKKHQLSLIEDHSIKLEEELIKQFKRNKRLKMMYESRFAALSGLLVDQGIALQTIESVLSKNDDENILLVDSDNDQLEEERRLIDDYQTFLNPLQKFDILSNQQQQNVENDDGDLENNPEYKNYMKDAINTEILSTSNNNNNEFDDNSNNKYFEYLQSRTINFHPPKKYEPIVKSFKAKYNMIKQKETKKLARGESQDKAKVDSQANGSGIYSVKPGKAIKSGKMIGQGKGTPNLLQKSPSSIKKYNQNNISTIPASKGSKQLVQRKRTETKKQQQQTPIIGEKKQRGRKSKKFMQELQLQKQMQQLQQQVNGSEQFSSENQALSQLQQQLPNPQQQQLFTTTQVNLPAQPRTTTTIPTTIPSTSIPNNQQTFRPLVSIPPVSQLKHAIPDHQQKKQAEGLVEPQIPTPYPSNLFNSAGQQFGNKINQNVNFDLMRNINLLNNFQNSILQSDMMGNKGVPNMNNQPLDQLQNQMYSYQQFNNNIAANSFDLTGEVDEGSRTQEQQQSQQSSSLTQRTTSQAGYINNNHNQNNDSIFDN